MRPAISLSTGLKPTLRQMMILILWSALVSAAVRMSLGWGLFGTMPEMICMNVAIFVGVWPAFLLSLLILILDRRSPVRGWYFSSCGAVGGFLTAGSFLLADLACFALIGRPTLTFPIFPLCALVCLWGSTMQARTLWPSRCQSCGHRAVIAVGRATGRATPYRGNKAKGWCASCGEGYEREGLTPWQPKPAEGDEIPLAAVRTRRMLGVREKIYRLLKLPDR